MDVSKERPSAYPTVKGNTSLHQSGKGPMSGRPSATFPPEPIAVGALLWPLGVIHRCARIFRASVVWIYALVRGIRVSAHCFINKNVKFIFDHLRSNWNIPIILMHEHYVLVTLHTVTLSLEQGWGTCTVYSIR